MTATDFLDVYKTIKRRIKPTHAAQWETEGIVITFNGSNVADIINALSEAQEKQQSEGRKEQLKKGKIKYEKANKERRNEKTREHHEEHKEVITEKRREKYVKPPPEECVRCHKLVYSKCTICKMNSVCGACTMSVVYYDRNFLSNNTWESLESLASEMWRNPRKLMCTECWENKKEAHEDKCYKLYVDSDGD